MAIKKDYRLQGEMLGIVGAGVGISKKHSYKSILHTSAHDFYPPITEYVDIHRDYNINIGDKTTATIRMPLGDFVKHVYPEKDKLEITLINTTVGMRTTIRYKFIITSMDKEVQSGTYDSTSLEELNKQPFTIIVGQCLNKTVENFRTATVYGVYDDATVSTVLNALLFESLGKFSFFGGLISHGAEIIFPNNNRKYKHIVVPSGTFAKDLPVFLQTEYGVYNGHISSYIQNMEGSDTLFIFPPYRTNYSKYYKLNLTLIVLNAADLSGIDSTYSLNSGTLKVLTTITGTQGNLNDSGEQGIKNTGNAIMAFDSGTTITRPVKVTPEKVEVSEDRTTRKMTHKSFSDGSKEVAQQHIRTNNFYASRSQVLKESGKVLQFQWNFSNARLLTPGMPVTVIGESKEQGIKTFHGVLQGVHIATENNKQMEASYLNVFLEKPSSAFSFFNLF